MYYTNTTLTPVLESVAIGDQLPFLLFKLQFFESSLRNVCKGIVLGLCGSGGGYRGGFCEKLLEASPMSDRANTSQLQDGPAAGQG